MRYFIKATKNYGAPYMKFNENISSFPLSFRSELQYATHFASVEDVVSALVDIGSRANIEKGELTIKGIETVTMLSDKEVEL